MKDVYDLLAPTADKLGMKIRKVTNDRFSFRIETQLKPQTVVHAIDDEMFMFAKAHALADLLTHTLEDMQLQLHDLTRAEMAKLDVRERIISLSREDKDTLHELLFLAGKAVSFRGPDGERDQKVYEKARSLVERLFR